MRFLPYVFKHLRHNWIRTASTVAAMSLCIFLFCTLETFVAAISWNLKSAGAARLITRHSVSLIFPLPRAYKHKLTQIPHVKSVAGYNFFAGFLGLPPDPRNSFPNFAIEGEDFLGMAPEYILTPEEKQAFLSDRRGCIVGPDTAKKFGWKVGDTVQLTSILPNYRKNGPFELVIRAIFRVDQVAHPGTNTQVLFFNYQYLDEATQGKAGINMYKLLLDDPNNAPEVSKAVDSIFENADPPTRTETEAAFRAGFLSLAGNLVLLLRIIGLAVSFTILLVTANTMSMAVRDRRTEIGVLKTLGFPGARVLGLVLAEALALASLGGGFGLLLARLAVRALPNLPLIGDAVAGFPNLGLQPTTAAIGMGLALLLGLLAGIAPALSAYRAKIADTLRTT